MPDRVAELVKRGLALAPEDRERLVDQLLESLSEPAASELNAAWEAEIERRCAQYDRGDVKAIDAKRCLPRPGTSPSDRVRLLPAAEVIFRHSVRP